MLKPCLRCGVPSPASWCDEHRPVDVRPDPATRGYDHAWQKLSRRARRLQPFCSDCGATDDLTADHLPEAWRRKAAGKPVRLSDVEVVCRGCNTRRGAARGAKTRGGDPSEKAPIPRRKAQGRSYTPGGIK